MGSLSCAAVLGALSGCSLIYNPNNLPGAPGEAGMNLPDAEIILDADPSKLHLESVFPIAIDEGAGDEGSRPALLVVNGTQIVAGATISIARTGGGATTAIVDTAMTAIADDGYMIAAPIKVPVDPDLRAGTSYFLDVVVTQANGAVTQMLPKAVEVKGYDELESGPLISGTYSHVKATGDFKIAAGGADPVIVHATAGIALTAGLVSVDANGNVGGPAGGSGGANGLRGADGNGPSPGLHNGGGGGLGTAGGMGQGMGGAVVNDAKLSTLAAPNRGSGGAGGQNGVGTGGVGGGGGGSIELAATGDLDVDTITAVGGKGTAHGGGIGPTDGGGGSGGVVFLRSGGALTVGAVSVLGGTSPSAGAGGDGRVRVDSASLAVALGATTFYRGPRFLATTPLITRDDSVVVTVTCQKDMPFNYYILDQTANILRPLGAQQCGPQNKEDLDLGVKATPLGRGVNHLCALLDGATQPTVTDEGQNCIDIVYVFRQKAP